MTDRLAGKVALISGAARGQGAAQARAFVAEGARVVIADVLDDEGRVLAKELGSAAHFVHLDVTSEADWAAAVAAATEQFSSLGVLVNNAGIMRLGPLESQPTDDFRAVIEVNQFGCFFGMRAAIPALRGNGGGSIVNTSSISGFIGLAGTTAYSASKFAIRGMTRCAALELGHDNIRVNSVHPGTIDTAMVSSPEFDDVDKDAYFAEQPIPRIGRADEVASVMVFLASDESSFCTGAEFVVDGGALAGHTISGTES
ncbi:MAG TPA: glucose 1-dehydrogenase [Frankiaceae bacterium]|jgi:3alpha(or 20beta)-hydroxysteroid dehydrogenase|nr:glucose 1-dehydrogenase [Frankiaceae bacterium]